MYLPNRETFPKRKQPKNKSIPEHLTTSHHADKEDRESVTKQSTLNKNKIEFLHGKQKRKIHVPGVFAQKKRAPLAIGVTV